MNGHDEQGEEGSPPDSEEEERRQHLADILERASAIHYSSPTAAVTPNNGLNMNASRPTGNGFLQRERRDARTRLRRALLATSLGIPRRRTNAAQHMPIVQDEPQNEPELTLADLDRTLNATYDYRYRPNRTAGAGNADGHADNNDANDEPHYNGHYSAPQLTTTSSLLMDTDEDDEDDQPQGDRTNGTNAAPPAGQDQGRTGDRARLRTMLLRGLAVPSTSRDISMGHSSSVGGGNNHFHHRTQYYQQHHQPPPHHVDATISLRTAIQRAHHDLVVLDDEFRRMCQAARSRRVDGDGNELQFDMDGVEEDGAPSSHHEQGQEQLARIVLPSSASVVARQASSFSSSSNSSHEDQQRETEGEEEEKEQQQQQQQEEEEEEEDRSKARANADVAGTAILPLARKDTKRAQAA